MKMLDAKKLKQKPMIFESGTIFRRLPSKIEYLPDGTKIEYFADLKDTSKTNDKKDKTNDK